MDEQMRLPGMPVEERDSFEGMEIKAHVFKIKAAAVDCNPRADFNLAAIPRGRVVRIVGHYITGKVAFDEVPGIGGVRVTELLPMETEGPRIVAVLPHTLADES